MPCPTERPVLGASGQGSPRWDEAVGLLQAWPERGASPLDHRLPGPTGSREVRTWPAPGRTEPPRRPPPCGPFHGQHSWPQTLCPRLVALRTMGSNPLSWAQRPKDRVLLSRDHHEEASQTLAIRRQGLLAQLDASESLFRHFLQGHCPGQQETAFKGTRTFQAVFGECPQTVTVQFTILSEGAGGVSSRLCWDRAPG